MCPNQGGCGHPTSSCKKEAIKDLGNLAPSQHQYSVTFPFVDSIMVTAPQNSTAALTALRLSLEGPILVLAC